MSRLIWALFGGFCAWNYLKNVGGELQLLADWETTRALFLSADMLTVLIEDDGH